MITVTHHNSLISATDAGITRYCYTLKLAITVRAHCNSVVGGSLRPPNCYLWVSI
jgi:hypothetical protein